MPLGLRVHSGHGRLALGEVNHFRIGVSDILSLRDNEERKELITLSSELNAI